MATEPYLENVEINHRFISTQITALDSVDKLVLIGEGSFIHAHDITSGNFLSTVQVFRSSAIHGIQHEVKFRKNESNSSEYLFLVFGQKSFSIIKFDSSILKWDHLFGEYLIEDWIIDASWITSKSVFILTAHNTVLQVETHVHSNEKEVKNYEKLPKRFVTNSAECNNKSLLYSGCLVLGNDFEDCVILAGTVFSQLLVWGPWGKKDDLNRVIPQHFLSGHEGVIFSVNYCKEKHLITTTSDDRTFIAWNIKRANYLCGLSDAEVKKKFLEECSWIKDASLLSANQCYNILYWSTSDIGLQLKCYGHSARVWKSLALQNCILSIGEDSKVCVWSHEGSLLNQWIAHGGASVWSMTVNKQILITGGGDSSVKLWSLMLEEHSSAEKLCNLPWVDVVNEDSNEKESNEVNSSNDMEDQNSSNKLSDIGEVNVQLFNDTSKEIIKSKINKNSTKDDFPRHIAFAKDEQCLVLTNLGKLWSYDNSGNSWSMIYCNENLKNYSMLQVHSSLTKAALGTLNGEMYILEYGENKTWKVTHDLKLFKEKVFSLHWMKENEILVCQDNGKLAVVDLRNVKSYEDSSAKSTSMREHVLPPCRQRWASTACYSSTYLIVGGRCGSVHLYLPDQVEPIHSLKKIHGNNGVTNVILHENLVVTCGRDGQIRWIEINDNKLVVLRSTRLGSGSWLAGIRCWLGQLYVLAFHGANLQVWDIETEMKVLEAKCGGGHRSWDFGLSNGSKMMNLAFLKDGVPYLCSMDFLKNIKPIVKSCFNTQETQCLKTLSINGGHDIFVTGCEDTSLRIHKTSSDTKNKCLEIIRSHIGNIRTIFEIKNRDKEKTLETWFVSGGGRALIKIWKMSSEGGDEKVVWSEVSSHMLHPTNRKTWKNQEMTFDPETRYMHGSGVWLDDFTAIIALASSDGYLRFMKFDKRTSDIELFCEHSVGFCVLRLDLVCLDSTEIVLLCTTSRGHIQFYDIKNLIREVTSEQANTNATITLLQNYLVHQSGINGLGVSKLQKVIETSIVKYIFKLATGGDDNKVVVNEVIITTQKGQTQLEMNFLSEVNGHCAQIMGMKWLKANLFVSCSNDQRIVIWLIDDLGKMVPSCSKFFNIPDVQGLDISHVDEDLWRFYIYGTGVQIFDVKVLKKL